MDNPKTVPAALKKHHFWILCGLVVVVGLGLWWMGTKTVNDAREKRTGEIAGLFDRVEGIHSTSQHPNQKTIAFGRQRKAELQKEVFEAWQRLYKEQEERNRLPDVLSNDFKMRFEALKNQPTLEMEWEYRRHYMEFIGDHIPTLFDIVDVLRLAPLAPDPANPEAPRSPRTPMGLGRGFPGPVMGGEGPMEYDGVGEARPYGERMIGVVQWAPTDRQRIEQQFVWASRPTTLEVRLAQEDLWVYGALLEIIAATNGPVKNHFDAAIREIQNIQIGREAGAAFQALGPGAFAAPGAYGGERGAGPEFDGDGYMLAPPSLPAPAGEYDGPAPAYADPGTAYEEQLAMLTGGRYVDAEGQPVLADQPAPFAEFNLMPVHMLLVMDQTKLARLLVACANSTMPVEVKSLRLGTDSDTMLNMAIPAQSGSRGGGMVFSSPDAGYRGDFGGQNDGYSRMGGPRPYRSTGGAGPAQRTTLYIPVEILGTICIYNPPNEEKLGTGAAAQTPSEPAPTTPAPGVAAVEGQPPPAGQ